MTHSLEQEAPTRRRSCCSPLSFHSFADAQHGTYILTADEGETLSSTEVDRGAFHPFCTSCPSHQHHSLGGSSIIPRGKKTGISTFLLGALPFLECMTLSRTEKHSFNVQAARPRNLRTTAFQVHSFWNNKPLWVEPPWQMESLSPFKYLGIQGTGMFDCLQVLSYKPCLSLSWTTSFPLGKCSFLCTGPGLLQKISATGAAGTPCIGMGWEALCTYLSVSLCF